MNKTVSYSLAASLGLLAALLFTGTPVPAGPADPAPCPTTRPSVLDAKLTDVQFPSIALEDVIDQVRELAHANIVVEWRVLQAAGVERTTPVHLHLWNVTLRQILKIILDDVSDNLSFQEQDGIITVSTCERLATNGVMRIYDIRPLLERLVNLTPGQPLTRNEAAQSIVDLIELVVDPDSWKDNGGVESVREMLGTLVIIQTPANHQKLECLLDELQSGQGPHIVQLKRMATSAPR